MSEKRASGVCSYSRKDFPKTPQNLHATHENQTTPNSHLVLGDGAEDSPHDLAGSSFGQAVGDLDYVGHRKRPDASTHRLLQLLHDLIALRNSLLERHKRIHACELQRSMQAGFTSTYFATMDERGMQVYSKGYDDSGFS